MNFSAALDYLYSLGHETLAMKFGLETTQTLLKAFSNPQNSFLKIQIAGTNGKGSVCAFLDAVCRARNLKTGLFTSPHLSEITERIKINGANISEAQFAKLASTVRETAETLVKNGKLQTLPTFFEHLTVIGLLAFREAGVDLAILETGLGGRLDSVTAAEAEIVVITPVSFDHQEFLGDTLDKIASEKAAIIRQNTRAVVSSQPVEAFNAISRRAEFCGVKLQTAAVFIEKSATADGRFSADFHTNKNFYPNVRINLRGRHQLENAATAISAAENLADLGFEISRSEITKGLENAVHAGRLELWKIAAATPILFDGAHNLDGAKSLAEFLREFFAKTPLTFVFGAMRDKDLRQITAEIFPLADCLILTRADNLRSAAPENLRQFAPTDFKKIYLAANAAEALQKAFENTAANGLIVVTGSLYLIGEAQKILPR
jgi:dihydrofolate synthase/folylpolyglutamate synthase